MSFPLLIKLLLEKKGLYTISEKDRINIDVFERLAAANLAKKPNEYKHEEWEWDRIHRETIWEFRRNKASSEIKKLNTYPGELY